MPKSAEFHIAPGYSSGHIKSPTLTGQVGDPSAWPSTHHSRTTSTVLSGFYDEECDDELFDCYDEEEEEEVKESLIREFVRGILLEANRIELNPPPFVAYPGPTKKAEADEDEDIIDEDELEEEEEVEEISAIGMGGGSGVSRGTIRGVTLPLGKSPPSFGRKRRTPAEAAGSGFGGAKPAKPVVPGRRNKGKKRKSRK